VQSSDYEGILKVRIYCKFKLLHKELFKVTDVVWSVAYRYSDVINNSLEEHLPVFLM